MQHPPTLLFPPTAAVSLTCCGGAASNGCPTYSLHHAYCPLHNTVTGGLIALAREGRGGRLKSHNWKIALRSVFEWAAWRQWCISLDEEDLSPETLDSVTGPFSIVVLSLLSWSSDNIEGPWQDLDQKFKSAFGIVLDPVHFHVFWLNPPPWKVIYCVAWKERTVYIRLFYRGWIHINLIIPLNSVKPVI